MSLLAKLFAVSILSCEVPMIGVGSVVCRWGLIFFGDEKNVSRVACKLVLVVPSSESAGLARAFDASCNVKILGTTMENYSRKMERTYL